ncbi:hypothetical protein M8C21_017469 [Ambrosia artemisiifolia]|uniref:HhH-GPD domain-containing protein n=1 Tax=Ambrosia artemisiifolia TaxID=4212 RepID=A0AAD5G3M4_AMBAR|nr:hypothetical protein M8C21_017469 [Ambrosia artemisiifolia]
MMYPETDDRIRSSKRIKLPQTYIDKLKTNTLTKFKPKLMRSPTNTPSSCRRVLDFGSVRTKTMKVYTKGGYCFTRQVAEYIDEGVVVPPDNLLSSCSGGGGSGFSSVRTKMMTIYTKGGDRFRRKVSIICNEKEEEEWLKEEQELFRQRASSFITAVRFVQGDRPFMGWKGSVVDSVVGVFLTQSASDSSSSSAFMYLAARYPKQNITGEPTEDTVDWDAVRTAKRSEISNAIEERGMNKKIAQRTQEFLHSIHDNSKLIDLEWLRSATAEEAKHYFMDVYGLGLKSTECLRLLTLRQSAFPVDRHVCRIVVRLGWIPIEKLPDGVFLHQLKEYELHCQMITFGKVFCTKKKPNCTSCPLKNDCKHFASACASENAFVPELEDIEDLCMGPKISKIAGRSRTKHRVYELYDTHPIVQQLDKRDQDDKHPYMLAVWPPVEESSLEEETVFGTFLVPCRTATRGSFPLDGTYFQTNEVFADDDTSEKPIVVPKKSLLELNTKTLYCGTSISNIFEGMSCKEKQECFLKGYVCIRGFNMKTREPRPLHRQFHQPLNETKTVKASPKPRK